MLKLKVLNKWRRVKSTIFASKYLWSGSIKYQRCKYLKIVLMYCHIWSIACAFFWIFLKRKTKLNVLKNLWLTVQGCDKRFTASALCKLIREWFRHLNPLSTSLEQYVLIILQCPRVQQSILPGKAGEEILHLTPSIFSTKTVNNISQWEFIVQCPTCSSIQSRYFRIGVMHWKKQIKTDFSLCGIQPLSLYSRQDIL